MISGVGCTLEDTVTGNVYDLTPLAAGGAFYNITKGGFKYNIKVWKIFLYVCNVFFLIK